MNEIPDRSTEQVLDTSVVESRGYASNESLGDLIIEISSQKQKLESFEKLGKDIQSRLESMKNDLQRANVRFSGIISESNTIKAKHGELSNKIDHVERIRGYKV